MRKSRFSEEQIVPPTPVAPTTLVWAESSSQETLNATL